MAKAKKIETIVRALVIKDGRVLLCRSRDAGHCYLPGGHVEAGESARDALARELTEEAGVQCRVAELAVLHEHLFEQGGRARHEYNLVFHVELLGKHDAIVSQEADIEFEWSNPAVLGSAGFVPISLIGIVKMLATEVGTRRGSVLPTTTFLAAPESR